MKDALNQNLTVFGIIFRAVRVILVLVVAVALARFLISLKKEPEKKEITKTPPSVNIIVATPISKQMTVEAFGTVKPRKSVKIAVEVPGRIVSLHSSFIEGGMIQKGELLATIDPQTYTLEKSAALVRIDQARTDIENFKQEIENLKTDISLSTASLKLAQKELDRVKSLTQSKYASKNSLDRTEQQVLQARMALQALENRLRLSDTVMETKKAALAMARVDFSKADLALKRTRIKADFNGFVIEKNAETGEYINPGQALGIMYEKNKFDVDIRIPIEKVGWLKALLKRQTVPKVSIVMANANGKENLEWEGQLARIKANIDEQTRTLPLTIEISDANKDNYMGFDLKPGAFVKCKIIGEMIHGIYELPRHLVKQGDLVYTVVDNKLKFKKINVLRKYEESVYIDNGLSNGDKIISSPLPGALEEMALTVIQNGKK